MKWLIIPTAPKVLSPPLLNEMSLDEESPDSSYAMRRNHTH